MVLYLLHFLKLKHAVKIRNLMRWIESFKWNHPKKTQLIFKFIGKDDTMKFEYANDGLFILHQDFMGYNPTIIKHNREF